MVSTSAFGSEGSGSSPDSATKKPIIMSRYFKWLTESNRGYHLLAGAFIAVLFGLIPVVFTALAVEFKDWMWNGSKGSCVIGWKTSNGFDWLDVLATVLGGLLTSLLSLFLLGKFNYCILTGVF